MKYSTKGVTRRKKKATLRSLKKSVNREKIPILVTAGLLALSSATCVILNQQPFKTTKKRVLRTVENRMRPDWMLLLELERWLEENGISINLSTFDIAIQKQEEEGGEKATITLWTREKNPQTEYTVVIRNGRAVSFFNNGLIRREEEEKRRGENR